jgi:hypothetical protein
MTFTDPGQRPLPSLMVGSDIVLETMVGPRLPDELEGNDEVTGTLEARTRVAYLQAYSDIGIEVSKDPVDDFPTFIPWSAVLAMYGRSKEELVQWAREDVQEARDRLLERLRSPQPEDRANLSQDADDYLHHNPHDVEIRRAQEALPEFYRCP